MSHPDKKMSSEVTGHHVKQIVKKTQGLCIPQLNSFQVVFTRFTANARITYVSSPPVLWIGQNLSLNCKASSLSPVNVTWYRGRKALASGISEAILTLDNITNKDWGEFLCVANNSLGVHNKSVFLKSK